MKSNIILLNYIFRIIENLHKTMRNVKRFSTCFTANQQICPMKLASKTDYLDLSSLSKRQCNTSRFDDHFWYLQQANAGSRTGQRLFVLGRSLLYGGFQILNEFYLWSHTYKILLKPPYTVIRDDKNKFSIFTGAIIAIQKNIFPLFFSHWGKLSVRPIEKIF